jgi:anti-sigma factor RsiW
MIRYECDTVRDLVPALVRGELLSHEEAAVESHLLGCDACQDESVMVRLIYETQPAVPAGLEARVLLAVRRPAARTWTPGRLAIAATFAAAVFGASVMVDRIGQLRPVTERDTLDASVASAFSWAASEVPLLHGSAANLDQLSVEELEQILAELGS